MKWMSLSPGAHGREAHHFICERLMTWISLSPGVDGLETHNCLNEVSTEWICFSLGYDRLENFFCDRILDAIDLFGHMSCLEETCFVLMTPQ